MLQLTEALMYKDVYNNDSMAHLIGDAPNVGHIFQLFRTTCKYYNFNISILHHDDITCFKSNYLLIISYCDRLWRFNFSSHTYEGDF